MLEKISLYVHIPYCKQKCIYCAFSSFCGKESTINSYFQKLKEELLFHKKEINKKAIKTIFIGGGTPSFVDANLVADLLSFIRKQFKVQKNAEISIECNPDSISLEKAKIWKESGINRVSVGLQSINNKTLKLLNRPHTFEDFKKGIEILKIAGFKNINADILLGIPGQTKNEVKKEVKILSELWLTHISAYGLMIEEGTPLFGLIESKKLTEVDEDKAVSLYNTAVGELKKFGYNRYEISNFSKPHFECKHNQNYWDRGEFLGVGLSAFSFLNGEHFENTKNLDAYLTQKYKKQNVEKENKKTAEEEFVMLSLRLEKGLNLKKYEKLFGENFLKKFEKQIEKLTKSGLIKIENGNLKITNFEVSNMIISEFF